MPRPARSIHPGKLPGAVLLPTYFAWCESCQEKTPHAGLGDEDGRELGSHCLCCGTPSENTLRQRSVHADYREEAGIKF